MIPKRLLKNVYLLDIIKIPICISPLWSSLIVIKSLTVGIIPAIEIIATARFIDTALAVSAGSKSYNQIYLPILIIVLLVGISWLVDVVFKLVELAFENDLRLKYRTKIIEKIAKIEYKYTEDSEQWNMFQRISEDPEERIKNSFNNVTSLLTLIFKIFSIASILFAFVWWAALILLVLTIPLFIISAKSGRSAFDVSKATTKFRRKHNYLKDVLLSRDCVDERALFGFSEDINKKWFESYEFERKIKFKNRVIWLIKSKIGSIATSTLSIGLIYALIDSVLTQKITIGEFVSLVTAFFSIIKIMSWSLTRAVDNLAEDREYFKDLNLFFKTSEVKDALANQDRNDMDFDELEFRNVFFKYPGTQSYVLKNLSFKIKKGMSHAFVGANGSGKTTIIKLMAGLYNDYEGDILLNGKQIRDYSFTQVKSIFSIVSQDFARYEISLKDNILLGNINIMESSESSDALNNALRAIGFDEQVKKMPDGINTYLGKIKKGSIDISGGEWQRVALARTIISESPTRILDEPTAAIDPISESLIYEKFEQISKNKTSLFITHRLGSTKFVNKIFVLDNGSIAEEGSHEELMHLSGLYCEMFESQRSWYT